MRNNVCRVRCNRNRSAIQSLICVSRVRIAPPLPTRYGAILFARARWLPTIYHPCAHPSFEDLVGCVSTVRVVRRAWLQEPLASPGSTGSGWSSVRGVGWSKRIDHFDKRESAEIGVAGADPCNSMLAHENSRVCIVPMFLIDFHDRSRAVGVCRMSGMSYTVTLPEHRSFCAAALSTRQRANNTNFQGT